MISILVEFTAPLWLKWAACDQDGTLYAYEHKPNPDFHAKKWQLSDGRRLKVAIVFDPDIDWKQSLWEIQEQLILQQPLTLT